ncbi:pilus assembly protein [Variovorax sp. RHLX14]|uniref:pilus assembly protein n=1 Tax=Variovorax sp. RHLX14 TaxID=1259731 RepID=UPI003F45861A
MIRTTKFGASQMQKYLSNTLAAFVFVVSASGASAVTLSDQPVFASSDVPGNLALALSVEFPTAISVANLGNYADTRDYLGYFDPRKCYTYQANTAVPAQSYFQPAGASNGVNSHSCGGSNGKWSGNFLNWATMQTIDPFRWALTGGYRSVDVVGNTILEKAWGSSQGGQNNFPLRGTNAGGGHNLAPALIRSLTPFKWSDLNISIWTRGNRMMFTGTDSDYKNTGKRGANWISDAQDDSTETYELYVRVKVCDPSNAAGGVEANCVKYGNDYKPEGLMQQYANKIRYSAFSYLYANGDTRQGGVMRAPMSFIGPTFPQPLSTAITTNPKAEWNSATGIMVTNPDSTLASNSGVPGSGAMNYLNKFGQNSQAYMTYDTVSELYYSVLRYFQNLENVPEWTADLNATRLDGFPAPASWKGYDPISYSCQKNFILGIGDNNTHFDVNVGGGTLTNYRPKPPAVSSDTLNEAQTWTRAVETLESLTGRNSAWGNQGSEYIAGLAYGAHVTDMRADLPGMQTVSTYWMDVMENQVALDRNPYWLATKYGGFTVPAGYAIGTPLTQSAWNQSGETINMNGATRQLPDNYFMASDAAQMVSGLQSAFTSIANAIKAFTTAFSFTATDVSSGDAAYASQYDSKGWTGVVTARTVTYAADGSPSPTDVWSTTTTLENQLSNSGWDLSRNVVTWNGLTGTPFRMANLTSSQQAALTTSYSSTDTPTQYLNFLRGDRSQESNSAVAGSIRSYRTRQLLLGDIVNAKVTPVAAPGASYGDTANPGYGAFKTAKATRPTMVYVGANDGMLHAFNGALTGSTAGTERFAYVPSAVFGKTLASDSDSILAHLGNPNYAHRYSVDATPLVFDIDFNLAGGKFVTTSAGTSDWHSLLIGGLGKGGKSYYAIDVTDPASMTSEATVASKVKWEFSDPTMGYSYGSPMVVKTAKYGWVVVLTSGYNNSDGYGYLYFVNPNTGALLEKVSTGVAAAGLTHATPYVQDFADYTSDAIYAGDLDGNVWRFDLTGAKSSGFYPAPKKLAKLTSAAGVAQPVTTRPLVEVHPVTRLRYVLVGTGVLLDSTDVVSTAGQSFYALIDGTASTFSTITTAATRSDLMQVADPAAGVALNTSSRGWYTELGSSGGVALRISSEIDAFNGIVAFSSLLTTGDACSPAGTSRVYVLNFATGKTVLVSRLAYVPFTNAVTDLKFITADGKPQLVVGDTTGVITKVDADLNSGTTLRLLNWREIPTAY